MRALAEETLLHSTEHGFPMLAEVGAVLHGWLLAQTGDHQAGAAQMRSAVAAYRAHGAGIGVPTLLGFLAEACGGDGRVDEGLAVVAEALAVSAATGAHYWDAELHRLRGTLRLAGIACVGTSARCRSAVEVDAEADLAGAVDIARRQRAKMLELRAATDLCRLWQRQGKSARARKTMSALLGGLVEEFDAPERAQATSLLDGLERDGRGRPRARRDGREA